MDTYLQFLRQLIYVAALFVVVVGICPKQLALFLELGPILELADACGLVSSSHAFDRPLELPQRHWFLNHPEVVFQGPRGKVDKRLEIGTLVAKEYISIAICSKG